jgi:serine/threonine protein kinase/Tfp pilus assembly protein PilF
MEGKIISHYKVLKRLGGGGMGEVYKAEDFRLKRTVALKFLPIHFSRDEEAKYRFIREAQTASSLDHPNICTIYEVDETKDIPDEVGGRLFIVMAYYEGETLQKKITPRLLSQSDVIEILVQVGKGLLKAHKQGIIHRDIKPANIMITQEGVAKIVDFGLARLASWSEITRPEIALGTLSYISPEQIQGKKIDHRTDIWSFGIMLYEMLTGELPFQGEIDQAVIYSILNEAPEPFRVAISQQLQRIIYMTLEKNPENRYQSMEDIINDLEAIEKENGAFKVGAVKPSIAVLPFKNMSNDDSQEYFCDGMAEEIINALTAVKGLRVVARTSSFSFKEKQVEIREIGRKLNVEMILEGSIRKSNERLRITAQLINVADGYHLWSEKYDRTSKDVFAIQDEISLSIIDKLKLGLLKEEKINLTKHHTKNIEAYHLLLKGRYFAVKMTKQDYLKSLKYYKKAIELDPQYSLAYSCLAELYGFLGLYYFIPVSRIIDEARAAAKKAIETDSSLSEAHSALGFIKGFLDWDFNALEKEFKKAIELNPKSEQAQNGYAGYLLIIGKIDEAVEAQKISVDLNPLSIVANNHLGMYLLRQKNYKGAVKQLEKSLELDSYHPYALWLTGLALLLDSSYKEGINKIKKALSSSNNFPPILSSLGWAYAKFHKEKDALKIVEELKKIEKTEFVSPYLYAKIYSELNKIDKAFKYIDEAYSQHDISLIHCLTDESIEKLRSDPRYIQLLRKIDLYKYYKQIT